MLRFTGSLIFFLAICQLVYGQNKYFPTAYRMGLDLTGVGYTILNPSYSHYEINNDLQFGKYFFVLDLGSVSREFSWEDAEAAIDESYIYKFSGRFFRAGIDYNFIPNDPDNNVIFFGARYGRAYFNDNIQFSVADDIFGNERYSKANEKLRGRWLEANAGMKIRVWNQIYLGYTLRMKFASKIRGENNLSAYEIPGYGKAAKNSVFGFNYHIFYRVPFK